MAEINVVQDDRFDPPWVAVCNEKIIASGHSRQEAYNEARKTLNERKGLVRLGYPCDDVHQSISTSYELTKEDDKTHGEHNEGCECKVCQRVNNWYEERHRDKTYEQFCNENPEQSRYSRFA